MGQKYPRQKRFRSSIPKCCRSRVGSVKRRFPTEGDARRVAKRYEDTIEYEVYPCQSGNGFHLRKKR